jgi:hypothetical protein
MYRNFAYEVVGQHRRLKATVKNCYFLTEFFKYFFRVLNEASSSWLKLFRVFQLHPVCKVHSKIKKPPTSHFPR